MEQLHVHLEGASKLTETSFDKVTHSQVAQSSEPRAALISHNNMIQGAAIVGLLPIWMVLLPLDITSQPEGWQVFVRANSFAVPIIQLIFVLIAMGRIFSPVRALKQLPTISSAALLVWLFIASLTTFQTGNDILSGAIGFFKLMLAGLFFLALVDVRKALGEHFLLTLWISIGCGAALYILIWAFHILTNVPQGDDWISRIPGVNNVRHLGHFAFALVTAGLFSLIAYRSSTKKWLRWALPVLFGSAGLGLALWTGSRGPLLAALVTIFATFCVSTGNRKTIATFFISSAIAATAVVATLPIPHGIYGITQATGFADVTAEGDASSGRTELWKGTIAKISERPLLGWGVNQFGKFGTGKADEFFHPHNFPLQLLFSGGILSALLVLLMFAPALRQWKWPYSKGPSAAGIGGVAGMLIYSLYDGVLYFSYPTMLFLLCIATSVTPGETNARRDTSG